MKLSTLKENLIRKYYKFKSRRKLISHYRYQLEVEEMMRDWISQSIVERKQEGRRDELVGKESRIQEIKLLLNYLKSK